MQTFGDQLQATRANLDRLEALAAEAPDLLGPHASVSEVTPSHARVYVHASVTEEAKAVDWPAMARKYRRANWQRSPSAAYPIHYWDWDGMLDGVEVCIIAAEHRPQPEALFPEAEKAQVAA